MRMLDRVAMTTALLIPMFAIAEPAAAQNYRWDFGVNGGYSWFGNMLDDDDVDLDVDFDGEIINDFSVDPDVRFGSNWLLGTQLGYWFTGNVGLRLNGTYADAPLTTDVSIRRDFDDDFDFDDFDLDRDALNNVNLWSASLDLMWRFRRPRTEWSGSEILPYLTVGLGAKWINPAGSSRACFNGDFDGDFEEIGSSEDCARFSIIDRDFFDGIFDDDDGFFALPKQTKFMGLIGLGTDFRLAPSFAIRLEVNDRIYSADLYALERITTDPDEFLIRREVSNTIHEIGVQAGLHLLMGLERPQVVTVIPAPAPPPPPPPPPAEEAISVCVVDLDERWGLRMQSAYYRPTSRDTVVIQNGTRVPLSRVVDDVRTARDADWYVRGAPLVLTIGNERVEFMTYQGARTISANQLAYLGTINGYPVFADRDEVSSFISQLQSQHERGMDELGPILAANKNLRDDFNNIAYVYVPLEETGCVFQALSQPEPVQKKQ